MATVEHETGLIAEATTRVWELVLSGEAQNPKEAVRRIWDHLRLDMDDLNELAILGLTEHAKSAQRFARVRREPGIAVAAPFGHTAWKEYLVALSAVYDDATGHPRPLIEFTVADWTSFSMRMQTVSAAYAERAQLGRSALSLLTRHNKNVTSELPRAVLRELAAEASRTLGHD